MKQDTRPCDIYALLALAHPEGWSPSEIRRLLSFAEELGQSGIAGDLAVFFRHLSQASEMGQEYPPD